MTETTQARAQREATIAALPAHAAAHHADRLSCRELVDGQWREHTYAETCATIDELARGLIDLGLHPTERVAILAETRREWTLCSYAISCAGCAVVPVYPTNSARECEWVLSDSGARTVICENDAQVAKVLAVRDRLPELAHIVCIEGSAGELTLAQLAARGQAVGEDRLRQRREGVTAADIYAIIYTSGTTGPPKGVVLTHANARAACDMIDAVNAVRDDEVIYLFLPLAHIYAQTSMLSAFDLGIAIVYFGGDTTQIVPELMATRPSYLPSVPRIFEKLYTAAMKLRDAGSEEDATRFDGAVRVGVQVRTLRSRGEPVPEPLQAIFERAEESLYARVRALFGGEVERALSAAAPIAKEILEFFYACGVTICEAWGMTETTGLGTLSTPEHFRFGTVGRPAPGLEIRIADDGEVLMRGPNVFREYWRNPQATADTVIDGWLHTGDLGNLDADGYLSITGRKKDIIITAGGKNLTPANLENDLKQSPFISQAVMHGDRRPYAVVLITLDAEEILPWAAQRGLPQDLASLATHDEVVALVQQVLDATNANYAPVEQVKRFAILERDFTIGDGELTPTLKVKRAVVSDRYAGVLDSLYA